ncbi:MAG: hypothetical protein OEZ48_01490 [Candidatus Bathyarchaeota archaeon]|nr:hypothetical protein [Candidatus Bathyarchaeota archaeon]
MKGLDDQEEGRSANLGRRQQMPAMQKPGYPERRLLRRSLRERVQPTARQGDCEARPGGEAKARRDVRRNGSAARGGRRLDGTS